MHFDRIDKFCIGLMCAVIGIFVVAFITLVITAFFKYVCFIGTKDPEDLFDKSRNIEQIQEALERQAVCRIGKDLWMMIQ